MDVGWEGGEVERLRVRIDQIVEHLGIWNGISHFDGVDGKFPWRRGCEM